MNGAENCAVLASVYLAGAIVKVIPAWRANSCDRSCLLTSSKIQRRSSIIKLAASYWLGYCRSEESKNVS